MYVYTYNFVKLINCDLTSEPVTYKFPFIVHTSASADSCRDHFLNVPSQWETTLHCKIISHWLGAYNKLSLNCLSNILQLLMLHLPHVMCQLYIKIMWDCQWCVIVITMCFLLKFLGIQKMTSAKHFTISTYQLINHERNKMARIVWRLLYWNSSAYKKKPSAKHSTISPYQLVNHH